VRPIVVVGAGAAGLMAAWFARERGHPVLLLERTRDGGRKILISGGGRCNVLPSALDPARYVTASSANSMRRLLRSWPLEGQRGFFEEMLAIPLALEEETGKLFPVSNRAREVRDALVAAVRRRGAEMRFGSTVRDIRPVVTGGWSVVIADSEPVEAAAVVLATGGLSVPATGSDGTGLRIAGSLGHTVHPTYPALTPLTCVPAIHAELAGISVEATLSAAVDRKPFQTRGGFLFTHRGYSGPSVLDISHLAVLSLLERREPARIVVQWTRDGADAWDRLLTASGGGQVGPLIRRMLPARLADALVAIARVEPATPLAQLRRDDRARLVETLTRYPLPWTGDEGYKKAEVTGGGVALGEVSLGTLESRVAPGLFLCGEMLDAFGPIGGYNFAWAWSTGRLAGLGAASTLYNSETPE
jgi:predicted Rossmann fold flavoprotein